MLQFDQTEGKCRIEKINRPDAFIHRGTTVGSYVQTYSRNQQLECGFAVMARSFWRLLNRQIQAYASTRRIGDSNHNRLIHNEEKHKTPQILFFRKRRFSRELGRNGTIMGMRITITTFSNLIDYMYHIQSGSRVDERGIYSTNIESISMVGSPNANQNTQDEVRSELKLPCRRIVEEEEQSETTSGED
ncbi:MAG: hypothetical protein EZS28_043992 [Streblomastix strix]|uniref:Uncharacterized protein n=1 Tax=Streblomastix strix TaxID=222440 RepID=A0A5J4TSN3_9EUKA|nr:MAG: hypothetical protein EZS28_043992 [Streblomastix strix]